MKGKYEVGPAVPRALLDSMTPFPVTHDATDDTGESGEAGDNPADSCVGEHLAVDRHYFDLNVVSEIEACMTEHISAIVALAHLPAVDAARGDALGPQARGLLAAARSRFLHCVGGRPMAN